LLALGLQGAWAFSLGGPIGNNPNPSGGAGIQGDAWQTAVIGYGLPGDINAPKNLGEEYRRNVPTNYYACDANFLDYFGSNGVAAVDGAFAILNGLTNVDSYSPSLSEFPLETRHLNYEAQAVGLYDLKSWTLGVMVEQLGLCDPVRYDWTLHDRVHIGTIACPADMEYLVVQRNFDPNAGSPIAGSQTVLSLYSPYVNDTLYSYYITEACTGPNPLALANPFSVDPTADTYSAVASFITVGLTYGQFYTGLTRDDVGGLRYLLSANNINFENAPAGSILLTSSSGGGLSYGPPVLLYTSNYNAFWWSARTNDPVTLSNLFPGLVILTSPYYFTNIATPILVAYYTNLIGAPYGSPPTLVVKTNGYTSSYLAIYSDTFANLVVTNRHPNTSASQVTVTVGVQIGAPYGSPLVTNTTTKTVTLANVPSGEYYINTNYLCGPPLFLSTLGTNVTATTNLLFATSNSAGYFTSQSLVISSTTHVYVVQWPICSTAVTGGVTNSPGYYQGIGGVRFVRVPDGLMDPLTHILTTPITTRYTNFVFNPANRLLGARIFQRVVTTPDIILSAADLAVGPAGNNFVGTVTRPVPNYEIANSLPGLAGPGVIDGQTIFTFNKVGPVFYNGPWPDTNGFTDLVNETTQVPALQWASFDGTTNLPILYPNGTSIQELENQMLISISPTSLPDGANTVAYPTTTFSASGGTSPYTWSLETGTSLPQGLSFSAGVLSGTPSGNLSGIYDFTIQVTDSQGLTVAMNYTITIQ